MLVSWEEDWNTGHTKIDEQHRNLIKIFNDLEKAILSEETSSLSKSREKALQKLIEYAEHHFETEEDIMRTFSYPKVTEHWRLHKDFKSRLYEIVKCHEAGETVLTSQILSFLKDWIDNHIKEEDRKLAEFIKMHSS